MFTVFFPQKLVVSIPRRLRNLGGQLKPGLLILLLIFSTSRAFAQSLTIGEISFPVDALEKIDSQSSKLSLFGETRIVANKNLEKTIIDAYLANSEAFERIGKATWVRFIDNSVKFGNVPLVRNVIEALLSKFTDDRQICELIDGWLIDKAGLEIGKEIVTSSEFQVFSEDCKIALLCSVGRRDIDWFRASALSLALPLRAELVHFVILKWSEVLLEGDFGIAIQLANLLEVISDDKLGQVKRVKLATELVQTAAFKGETLSLSDLLPIISLRNSHSDVAIALDPIIVNYIHEMANRALIREESETALTLLSQIRPSSRTIRTHQLVSRSLMGLPLDSTALGGKQVSELVGTIAKNDKNFRDQIWQFYENKINRLLEQNALSEAESAFRDLRVLRPDPSESNDKIRIQLALVHLGKKNRQSAHDVLAGIETGMTWRSRIELLLAGLYGNILLYVLLLAVPIIVRIAFSVVRSVTPTEYASSSHTEDTVDLKEMLENVSGGSESTSARRNFVTRKAGRQLDPLYEEYLDCLHVFGLDESNDVRSIKLAYRNAVKEIHPDLNLGNQTPDTADRFIRYTKAYDRIRELQKILNIKDSIEE